MEKKYLYGVIRSDEVKTFGVLDISADEPAVIKSFPHGDLSVIYTALVLADDEEIQPTRKNLINHQRVIERVMEEHTVLPFGFGMVVSTTSDLIDILSEKRQFFEEKLDSIQGKIELNIKGVWDNMAPVYEHITQSSPEILSLKNQIQSQQNQDQNDKIELGKKVEFALTLEKERLCDDVITSLASTFEDYRLNKNISDSMFCNLAFLISKDQEKLFDEEVNKLADRLSTNMTFKYVGPLPPYNFLD